MVHDGVVPRQIWATPTKTSTVAASKFTSAVSSKAASALCTIALPAPGILRFNDTYFTTLDSTITFESACGDQTLYGCNANTGNSTVVKFDDPFYASVVPQIFALATATVISYILVILIFITPRTFYVGGPGGGANFLGLRSLVPGSGSSSVIGVGRRPLLQKIAALTVAVSLTIATADTFIVAERQYNSGLMDSQQLVEDVISSTEIRVVRVVSDTFLWLAQVQTLIRLFPRHKEKVTIKWLGFALVTCDTVFSILVNFVSQTTLTRPRSFQDAIPALSYLFQMSISLIYASCVIYYSLSKRRFAFWHSKMRNVVLVAAISLAAVLVPVVFFVIDVSQPNIAAWGEYIRWVGAAAASVVVWEWVERIEALERDERKDGILGREIFDGDEMLTIDSDNKSNSTSNYFGFGKRTGTETDKKVSMLPIPHVRPRVPFRRKKTDGKRGGQRDEHQTSTFSNGHPVAGTITRPPQTVTPVSRSDTTSAASTIYQVRYRNVSSPSPAIPEVPAIADSRRPSVHMNGQTVMEEPENMTLASNASHDWTTQQPQVPAGDEYQRIDRDESRNHQVWQVVSNPFKRKRTEPPAEVAAQIGASNIRRSPARTYNNLRDRIHAFTSSRVSGRQREGPSPPMPVTVIPAQPRNGHQVAPGEAPHASRQSSRTRIQGNRQSSSSRSRRESMPVTVIPAPVRGGRTWSPDDLKDEDMAQSSAAQGSSENATSSAPSPAGDSHITRGTLTIAESPARLRDRDNRDSPAASSQLSRTRLLPPTIDLLNDRLSSVSPGSAARSSGSRNGSEGRQRGTPSNVTNNSSLEPPIPEHNGRTSDNALGHRGGPLNHDEPNRDNG